MLTATEGTKMTSPTTTQTMAITFSAMLMPALILRVDPFDLIATMARTNAGMMQARQRKELAQKIVVQAENVRAHTAKRLFSSPGGDTEVMVAAVG